MMIPTTRFGPTFLQPNQGPTPIAPDRTQGRQIVRAALTPIRMQCHRGSSAPLFTANTCIEGLMSSFLRIVAASGRTNDPRNWKRKHANPPASVTHESVSATARTIPNMTAPNLSERPRHSFDDVFSDRAWHRSTVSPLVTEPPHGPVAHNARRARAITDPNRKPASRKYQSDRRTRRPSGFLITRYTASRPRCEHTSSPDRR